MNTPNPLKIASRLFLLSLALTMVCTTLRGQDSAPAAPAAPASPVTPLSITPEQKDQLKAAYDKAMQDPKVLAARKVAKDAWDAYRTIVKKKILANDPGMASLFDKADKAGKAMETGEPAPPLTADDKQALHDALQKVDSDPDIKDALTKTVEAGKAQHELVRAAILKIDPALGPVLDEIDSTQHAPAPGGQ